MVGVDGQTGDHTPEREPGETDDEHPFVAVDVAEATGQKDEAARGQTVGGDEPAEFAGVGDGIAVPDDVEDGEALTETGLGAELSAADYADEKDLLAQG